MNKMNHFTVLPRIEKDSAIKDHYKKGNAMLTKTHVHIEKLDLDVKELQRELQETWKQLKDLAFSRDRFSPVKMKEEPYCPF